MFTLSPSNIAAPNTLGQDMFAVYVDNCVLDINKHYSDFVKEIPELINSLQSGKTSWIEAMVRRSSVKTLDLPKIILDHWNNPHMQSFAKANQPKLLESVYKLRDAIDEFRHQASLFMESPRNATSADIERLLYLSLAIYRHVRHIARDMRDVLLRIA